MPNGENRKIFLHSRKSIHTFPFSVLTFSARSFQTLGIFRQFRRTFSKFRRTFSKFQGKKSEKYPTKLCKQHVVSSQTSTSFEKVTCCLCNFVGHFSDFFPWNFENVRRNFENVRRNFENVRRNCRKMPYV